MPHCSDCGRDAPEHALSLTEDGPLCHTCEVARDVAQLKQRGRLWDLKEGLGLLGVGVALLCGAAWIATRSMVHWRAFTYLFAGGVASFGAGWVYLKGR